MLKLLLYEPGSVRTHKLPRVPSCLTEAGAQSWAGLKEPGRKVKHPRVGSKEHLFLFLGLGTGEKRGPGGWQEPALGKGCGQELHMQHWKWGIGLGTDK